MNGKANEEAKVHWACGTKEEEEEEEKKKRKKKVEEEAPRLP
jgi:hypothetical protein